MSKKDLDREWRKNNAERYIDHDHKTGHVRGLLCYYCNTGIGNFDDSISRLESAITYLEGKNV